MELQKHGRPRVLTHNGKAAAVVLSVAAYEKLAHAAEEQRLNMELKAAVEAYANGDRGRPLKEAFDDLHVRLFTSKSGK